MLISGLVSDHQGNQLAVESISTDVPEEASIASVLSTRAMTHTSEYESAETKSGSV